MSLKENDQFEENLQELEYVDYGIAPNRQEIREWLIERLRATNNPKEQWIIKILLEITNDL